MSNKLKQITTKAKQLYKTGKFAKWTDAIKAASKSTATTKKVGAVKKKAAKKITKKAAPKKAAAKSYHKDTKSHNVRISVVSGIGNLMTFYKNEYGNLSAKKLMETTKRGKSKIAKKMTEVAAKIKKLKNW